MLTDVPLMAHMEAVAKSDLGLILLKVIHVHNNSYDNIIRVKRYF